MKRAISDQAKIERKELLLKAALDEFFENGFSAARMDDIAQRAGLSKGTLYLYFESKEDLFHGLIEAIALPQIEELEEFINNAPSFSEFIDGFAERAPIMITETDMPRLKKVMIAESHSFPDIVVKFHNDIADRILTTLADALERASEQGEIEVDNPKLTAAIVFSLVAHASLWDVIYCSKVDDDMDLVELFRTQAKLLKRALLIK